MIQHSPFFKVNITLIIGIILGAHFQNILVPYSIIVLYLFILFFFTAIITFKFIKNHSLSYKLLIFGILLLGTTLSLYQNKNRTLPAHKGVYLKINKLITAKENIEVYEATAQFIQTTNSLIKINQKVILSQFNKDHFSKNASIYIPDTLQKINLHQFSSSYNHYLINQNIHHKITANNYKIIVQEENEISLHEKINTKIEEIFPEKLHGISSALLIGVKSKLSKEEKKLFQQTGNMHLLALSGMHVGIIVLLLELLFSWKKYCSKKNQIFLHLIQILILWGYVYITSASPSIIRAVSMFSVLIIGQVLKKKTSMINTLSFTSFCFLIYDPFLLFDIGFSLSFSAVLFIGIFPHWGKISTIPYYLRIFLSIIIVSILAQLGTISIVTYYFKFIPIYSLISGLLSGLFTTVLMYEGIIILIADFLNLPLEILLFIFEKTYNIFTLWLSLFYHLPQLPPPSIHYFTAILLTIGLFTFLYSLFNKKSYFLSFSILLSCAIFQFYQTYSSHLEAIYFYNSKIPSCSYVNGNTIHSFILSEKKKFPFSLKQILNGHQKDFLFKETHFLPLTTVNDSLTIKINPSTLLIFKNNKYEIIYQDSLYFSINQTNLKEQQLIKYRIN